MALEVIAEDSNIVGQVRNTVGYFFGEPTPDWGCTPRAAREPTPPNQSAMGTPPPAGETVPEMQKDPLSASPDASSRSTSVLEPGS